MAPENPQTQPCRCWQLEGVAWECGRDTNGFCLQRGASSKYTPFRSRFHTGLALTLTSSVTCLLPCSGHTTSFTGSSNVQTDKRRNFLSVFRSGTGRSIISQTKGCFLLHFQISHVITSFGKTQSEYIKGCVSPRGSFHHL